MYGAKQMQQRVWLVATLTLQHHVLMLLAVKELAPGVTWPWSLGCPAMQHMSRR